MRHALDKISTIILRAIPFVLSFFVPLFFLPFTTEAFVFNKYYLVAVLGTISLIAWCIRNLTRGKIHFTISPAFLPLVILVLANLISSVWLSPIKHTSLFGQTSLFFFLCVIFITVTSSQKNQLTINSAIYGLVSSASLLSLFTLLQYFGLLAKVIPSDLLANRYFNPSGSILPALSLTIPVLIGTVIYTTKVKNWTQKSLLFLSVLLMIVGSIINISYIMPQNGQPVLSILPLNAGWSIAVDTFKNWDTALFGTGPETYLSAFTKLRPTYLNLDKYLWSIRFSESSNLIFTLITTTGLVGSIAFVLSFLRPIIASFKSKDQAHDTASLYFLTAALITTLLSFFVIPTGIISITLAVVLVICLTIDLKIQNSRFVKDITYSLSSHSSPAPSSYHDLSGTAETTAISSFLPWVVTAISVAVLSAFWFFAVKMYAASVAYQNATNQAETNLFASFTNYQKAAQLDIYNPYYQQKLSQIYLAYSEAYLSKKDATNEEKNTGSELSLRAIDSGKIAVNLDPYNVSNWENLFTIYRTLIPYAEGSADLAISHGLQAASIDPTNPTIYLELGILFYNLGDSDQAIKLIDRAIELKTDWNLPYYNLASIYKAEKNYTKALQYDKAGLQYTDASDENLSTIQDEIKSLEKLVPAAAQTNTTATPSATVQQ